MLMYFNAKSFYEKPLIYEKNDCCLKVDIPVLNINLDLKNTNLCDPGWYFMLWSEINNVKCKDIDIDEYISHMWYGSENRKTSILYSERLEQFKKANLKYL